MTEYAGEFFGTMVLVIIGNGANCQVLLGSDSRTWTSLSFAWATAVAMGVWISGGGHVNPAVTIAFSTWRSFPWRKVPGYVVAQLLGAIVGAAIVYATYFHAIDIVEGGHGVRTMKTAGLFGTFPVGYLTSVSCFFSEFLNTAILLFGILALTDTSRNTMPAGLLPIGVWILVYGIGAALGIQTGFALNPARDLGPRILTAMVGYGGQVFSTRHQYWIWTPIIATILGALAGTTVYDLFLYNGHESLANKW
ncbi:aquaporin-like protein [Cyathus striatus]|nr:aquaporin-like protein [Cyathus striatus]